PSPVRLPDGAELLVYRQVPQVHVVVLKPPAAPKTEPVKPRRPPPLGPQRPRGVPRRGGKG
ncbi:MAG: hypothetical protein ACREIU_04430, partial [Planctomycetota bacterium]